MASGKQGKRHAGCGLAVIDLELTGIAPSKVELVTIDERPPLNCASGAACAIEFTRVGGLS